MKEKIRLIMSVKNLSPADLADALQVQRSGISHILSGRNNPSLDFMKKVAEVFPDLSADWLLRGKGPMLNNRVESAKDAYKPNEREKSPLDLFSSDEKLLAEEGLQRQIAAQTEHVQENKPIDMLENATTITEKADNEVEEIEKETKALPSQPLETDMPQVPVEKEIVSKTSIDIQNIKKEVVAWVAIYSDNTFKMYHQNQH